MKCKFCERDATHCHYLLWKEKPLKGNHRIMQQDHPELFQNLCALCHAKVHNTEPKKSELKQYILLRERAISAKNIIDAQIRGLGGVELLVPDFWLEESKRWEQQKLGCTKKLEHLLKEKDSELIKYLKGIKGISVVSVAYILAYLPVKDEIHVGLVHPKKLRAYWGLDPTHMKRRKGMSKEEVKKCGLGVMKKQLLGIIADNLVMKQKKYSGTPQGKYYDVYKSDKERRLKLHPELKKIHIEKQARRRMIEVFVNDLFYIAKKEQNGGEKNTGEA